MYGTNNLPDSSNMCHESTSVGLPLTIGVPVGTVTLDDFEKTDCIMIIGHNTGVNAPRMLHPLQECAKRGVPIIIFNPLRERGFERFTNPQSPIEMLSGSSTPIASQYHQINVGGDKAALMGVCKALFELDDAERKAGREGVLDRAVHCRPYPRIRGIRDVRPRAMSGRSLKSAPASTVRRWKRRRPFMRVPRRRSSVTAWA